MAEPPDQGQPLTPPNRDTTELTSDELDQVVGGLAREWRFDDDPAGEISTDRGQSDLFGVTLVI